MVERDAPRRRLFVMRHGAVTYFEADGRPVRPDTVALNEEGRAQADAAGALFAGARIRFDRVLATGLARTQETAARVLAACGQEIEIATEPRLREIEGGKLSEIPDERLREAFVGAFDGVVAGSTRFLGGESVDELFARVVPAVEALRADPGWDTVLVVGHGGVNRALISWLLSGEPRMLGGLAQSPACVNALDLGHASRDVVLRILNLAPLDPLQAATRKTTMEALHEQYLKYRQREGRDD